MKKNMGQLSEQSNARCPLCLASGSEILAHELRRGNGLVRYCAACDHGYLIQEQALNMKEYYGEFYRQEYSHNAEVARTNAQEIFNVYKNYQQDRLKYISPYLTKSSRLLEVGASSGQFLTHIKDKVKDVHAIELDKACCLFLEKELGINADTEFLESSRFADQTYEIVCAFQVMEHVERPVKFIQTLKQATKKGGAIFIEVPNLNDPLMKVWDVPAYQKFFYHSAHLHYFTEHSLSKVAQNAGFRPEQIEISFTQDYNLLNHLHWIMNNGPQADCHIGLSQISFTGHNKEISSWLAEEMYSLNQAYIAKLIAAKCTSNMLMKLRND